MRGVYSSPAVSKMLGDREGQPALFSLRERNIHPRGENSREKHIFLNLQASCGLPVFLCDAKTLSLLRRQLPFKKGSLLAEHLKERELCKMCKAFFTAPRAPARRFAAARGCGRRLRRRPLFRRSRNARGAHFLRCRYSRSAVSSLFGDREGQPSQALLA